MVNRKQAEEVFKRYTSHYDMANSMIWHKVVHTFKVAENCERIAGSLEMPEEAMDFAWFLGLLHDIGRFEQVKQYGTFLDAVSVDHAEFGADLLFKEQLIKEFPIENLSGEQLQILETAIRFHNKLKLPDDMSKELKCFSEILRDADKADIFRVITEIPLEERIGSSKDMIQVGDEANEEVMECVRKHCCIPRKIRKTKFEIHISHLCMAFELVFPESRRIVREQGFLEKLFSETDEHGYPLFTKKQSAQLEILRTELEKTWSIV